MINFTGGFAGLVQSIVGIFNLVLPVLVAAALVFFFVGVVRYIYHEGEAHERTTMLWSLVALFIMMSIWGILRLMCSSIMGSATCQAPVVQSFF